ncbi:MAG: hypothetical protein ACTHJ3_07680 [Pararhizobium sp.]
MVEHDVAIAATMNLVAHLVIMLRDKGVFTNDEIIDLVRHSYEAGSKGGPKEQFRQFYKMAFPNLPLDQTP